MKKKFLFFFALIASIAAFSQAKDSLAPYQRFATIPPFKIQLMDSVHWLTKKDLSTKKPTWIIYFSPDCGHCQLETEEIISHISSLKNVQIVMVTSRPFEDVKSFYDHYLLSRFPNINVGVDPDRLVVNFYNVEFTPFSALYKKGKLVKVYKNGVDWDEFLPQVKK